MQGPNKVLAPSIFTVKLLKEEHLSLKGFTMENFFSTMSFSQDLNEGLSSTIVYDRINV